MHSHSLPFLNRRHVRGIHCQLNLFHVCSGAWHQRAMLMNVSLHFRDSCAADDAEGVATSADTCVFGRCSYSEDQIEKLLPSGVWGKQWPDADHNWLTVDSHDKRQSFRILSKDQLPGTQSETETRTSRLLLILSA